MDMMVELPATPPPPPSPTSSLDGGDQLQACWQPEQTEAAGDDSMPESCSDDELDMVGAHPPPHTGACSCPPPHTGACSCLLLITAFRCPARPLTRLTRAPLHCQSYSRERGGALLHALTAGEWLLPCVRARVDRCIRARCNHRTCLSR